MKPKTRRTTPAAAVSKLFEQMGRLDALEVRIKALEDEGRRKAVSLNAAYMQIEDLRRLVTDTQQAISKDLAAMRQNAQALSESVKQLAGSERWHMTMKSSIHKKLETALGMLMEITQALPK